MNVNETFKRFAIQTKLIPTPSRDELGKIYQYVGQTTDDFKEGYFYKCVESQGVYSRENVKVQAGDGASGDISDLDDVEITNPTDWQILGMKDWIWKNVPAAWNVFNISEANDVSITAPLLDDETLVFDEGSQVFKNKSINDYVKTKIDRTTTLPWPNTSDSNYFGMLIPKSDIKSITIDFDTEETSYPRAIYKINWEIAVNTPLVLITSGTWVVGQPLELNHHFTGNEILAVGWPNGIHFKYGQQNHTEYKLISIKDWPYIKGVLNGYYMKCTYTYEVYTDKYNTNDLTGKKIMLLGDSMTAGHTTPVANRRATILGEKNNMTVDNRASNGAYMYDDETSGYKDVSIYKKVCDTTATNYIPDSAFEWVDYIIVYGGTNDVKSGSVTLWDVDSNDPSDFCGAVNVICNTLQTRAPSAHIGFITPQVYSNTKTRGLAFNQAIKDVCAKYSIPVYDQWAESGINRGNAAITSTLTLWDGTHLNNAGHAFVEQKYEAFIRRI